MSDTVPSQCSQCCIRRRDVKTHIVAADIFSVSLTAFQKFEMDDELLIELVRSYPALYDLSNRKYMDSNFKQELWKKIGEEMKLDGKFMLYLKVKNLYKCFKSSLGKK